MCSLFHSTHQGYYYFAGIGLTGRKLKASLLEIKDKQSDDRNSAPPPFFLQIHPRWHRKQEVSVVRVPVGFQISCMNQIPPTELPSVLNQFFANESVFVRQPSALVNVFYTEIPFFFF